MRTKLVYSCPKCGGTSVQLSFPVWVLANDMDNQRQWEMDGDAQPHKDSDKGWCLDCEDKILVKKEEVEIIGPVCPCCFGTRIAAVHRTFSETPVLEWSIEEGEYQPDDLGVTQNHEEEFFAYKCLGCGRTLARDTVGLKPA